MEWFVPDYDEALPPQSRIGTIELVWTGAGYKIQLTPFALGDVKFCNEVVEHMNNLQNTKTQKEGE